MPPAQNPYIIGRPIYDDQERFFGREELFRFIESALHEPAPVILLRGQRRIGKTSVLCQIPARVRLHNFFFVYFDLQDQARHPLGQVLHELARTIAEAPQLEELPTPVSVPSIERMEARPDLFATEFLPAVRRVLPSKSLVLVLDEFDVLGNYRAEDAGGHLFPFLRSVIDQQRRRKGVPARQRLFLVAVIGRRLDEIENLLDLFKGAPNQEIALLDRESATRLIREPAAGALAYSSGAIDAILALTAGHPYFTQLLCHVLFDLAQQRGLTEVPTELVEESVGRALEAGLPGLLWFRDGLPYTERVLFSAVAEVQALAARAVSAGQVFRTLQEYGVLLTRELEDAVPRLLQWGFLLRRPGSSSLVVTVEMVRRWLARGYPLRREIGELSRVSPEAQTAFKRGQDARAAGRRDNALEHYREALRLNPNHLDALQEAAELAVRVGRPEEAVDLCRRAAQVDPERNTRLLAEAERRLADQRGTRSAPEPAVRPLRLYPVYVEADSEHWRTLKMHLTPFRRSGRIEVVEPLPGEDRQAARDRADIIVVLVSREALYDERLYDEIEGVTAKSEQRGIRVVPVLLEPAPWKDTSFASIQVLPRNGLPLSEWSSQDAGWMSVMEGIRSVVDVFSSRTSEAVPTRSVQISPLPTAMASAAASLRSQRAVILASHRDYSALETLTAHLAALVNTGQLTLWHQGMIPPGTVVREEWLQHLDQADLIIMMVSPDLQSLPEFAEAQRRALAGAAKLVLVRLRPALLPPGFPKDSVFVPERPIIQWPDQDEAWLEVTQAVHEAIMARSDPPLFR